MGIIVRTAGLNRNKTELQRDFTYLQRLWTSIHEKSEQSAAPALIYQEHDLVLRSIRDYFTPDIQEVLVDHREVYRRARDFFQAVMPRYQGRVKLYRERKPLFAKYQLEEQIEAIYTHKVELKSGGSIVIDPTEALVAIDVNSGRATKEKDIEETAFKTNLEAAEEVARQLRLRDLGGLIVVDFIDMRTLKHIQEVEKSLRQAVKRDKARTQLSRISQFGLLELSRQRLKPTILEGNYLKCPHCEGSGLIKSAISLALLVLRRIRTEAARENVASVHAVLPMETAEYLLNQKRKELFRLEEDHRITINVSGNPAAHHNDYELAFKRRDTAAEAPVVTSERGGVRMSRESTETIRPPRRRRETKPPEVVPVKPAMNVSEMPAPSPVASKPAKVNDVTLPRAVTRGRIFWRLVAASRHAEMARSRHRSRGGGHSRSGRSSGRFGRRTRTWWRRRSQTTPAEVSPAAETPRANESLG
jgi:ribonuclease E